MWLFILKIAETKLNCAGKHASFNEFFLRRGFAGTELLVRETQAKNPGCDVAKWLGCFLLRVGKKILSLWCFRFRMMIWAWFFYIILGCWLFLSYSITVRPQSSWKLSFSSEQCIGKSFFSYVLCVYEYILHPFSLSF